MTWRVGFLKYLRWSTHFSLRKLNPQGKPRERVESLDPSWPPKNDDPGFCFSSEFCPLEAGDACCPFEVNFSSIHLWCFSKNLWDVGGLHSAIGKGMNWLAIHPMTHMSLKGVKYSRCSDVDLSFSVSHRDKMVSRREIEHFLRGWVRGREEG